MNQTKAQASRVNITKYVKVATRKGEGWRFCPVVPSSKRPHPRGLRFGDGRTEFHKEGAYYTSGMRRENGVDNRWVGTHWTPQGKETILKNAALGIQVVGEDKREKMLSEACRAVYR